MLSSSELVGSHGTTFLPSELEGDESNRQSISGSAARRTQGSDGEKDREKDREVGFSITDEGEGDAGSTWNARMNRKEAMDSKSIYTTAPDRRNLVWPRDSETLDSTRSLYEADMELFFENDRRYSPYYSMPNDEEEQLRMNIQHQVLYYLFDKQLTTIPLESPERILDVGTGTGEWAIEWARSTPSADVIGTDIVAIHPSAVPHNVYFERFDATDEQMWTYPPDCFDLIHFRQMIDSFLNWDRMYRHVLKYLKPGGWIEVIDYGDQSAMAPYFVNKPDLFKWFEALKESSVRLGRGGRYDHLSVKSLEATGYVDVKLTEHKVPLGSWTENENLRRTGKLWLITCLATLEAVSLQPLTKVLGWDVAEVRALYDTIGQEFKAIANDHERCQGFNVQIRVLIGRRPLAGEASDAIPPEENRSKNETGVEQAESKDVGTETEIDTGHVLKVEEPHEKPEHGHETQQESAAGTETAEKNRQPDSTEARGKLDMNMVSNDVVFLIAVPQPLPKGKPIM